MSTPLRAATTITLVEVVEVVVVVVAAVVAVAVVVAMAVTATSVTGVIAVLRTRRTASRLLVRPRRILGRFIQLCIRSEKPILTNCSGVPVVQSTQKRSREDEGGNDQPAKKVDAKE
jgi:hypothetical protein